MRINYFKLESVMANRLFTVKELAKRSGVSEVTITRIRNKVQKPRPLTVGKIAMALGCEIEEIIEDE